MGTICIGTSGYSYRDWSGNFYPADLKPGDFLSYYSSIFTFTELNFSYYRQPKQETLRNMIHNTPAGFRFSIKAHRSLTHEISDSWKQDVEEFRRGIEPLPEHDRLLGVLLQFPYSFHYTRENRKYLSLLGEELSAYPLYVEFRNNEWQKEAVYRAMAERGMNTVAVDQPELPRLPDKIPPVTAGSAYLRFHGRNAQEWWTGDNVSRYNYLYTAEELQEWVPSILDIAEKAAVLVIAFNNHYKGKGPQNALQLKGLLAGSSHSVV